jgi:hypothetical protein
MVTVSPSAEATEKFLRPAHGDCIVEFEMAGCEMTFARRVALAVGRKGLV